MNSLTVEDLGKRAVLGRQNRSACAGATLDGSGPAHATFARR